LILLQPTTRATAINATRTIMAIRRVIVASFPYDDVKMAITGDPAALRATATIANWRLVHNGFYG
jgi:hypothetical protein